MNETPVQTKDERHRVLVLARLLPKTKRPLSRAKMIASVASCLGTTDAKDAVTRSLDACIAAGLVEPKPLRLSENGREMLRTALGVGALPKAKDWGAVRRGLLADLSLGRKSGKAADSDAVAAAVLGAEHGVAGTSLRAVVDRMAWRALGVESSEPFDAGRVQRHLLRDLVAKDARVDLRTWRRLLAVRAVGAKRSDAQSLRQAALKRWLEGTESRRDADPVLSSASANDNAPAAPALPALADAVAQAARAPAVVRFHDDRAFIGSIWEYMRGRPPIGDMSLADFKAQLVAAHRAGLLRMTRADLVAAMDIDEVQKSEATYLGATFHFVALDAVGGR